MDCREAQERIIESLEAPGIAETQRPVIDHLQECSACADFAGAQNTLDQRLHSMLPPQDLSPGFRTALRQRIRRETVRQWPDHLPEVVHFLSCSVVTLLFVFLLPFDKPSILAAGGAATILMYVVLTAVRGALEGVEEGD